MSTSILTITIAAATGFLGAFTLLLTAILLDTKYTKRDRQKALHARAETIGHQLAHKDHKTGEPTTNIHTLWNNHPG